MARYRSLTDLLLDVRQRTNMENSTFCTDGELTEYLNQAIAELQVRLAIAEGQPHFRSSTSFAVTPPVALYPLPADFWAVQEVTATLGNSIYSATMTLRPFMVSERASMTNASPAWPVYDAVRYRVQAGNIEFLPATEGFMATLYYHPSQARLSLPGDVWDGFNGYEMGPIYDVCATVAAKEETDPSFFLGQRDRIYRLIEQAAAHRDMSNPERVDDVTSLRDPMGLFGWSY